MMRAAFALALCLVASTCSAQFASSEVRETFRGFIAADTDARAVNVVADTFMAEGTAVAGYFTTNRYSTGPAFGLLAEVQDVTGRGELWAMEIDAFSRGPDGTPGSGLRRGLGVVLGVNQGKGEATIGYGIDVLCFFRDCGRVRVHYGLHIGVPADVAAIAVQAGERVALEESGRIAIRFNPKTNAVEIVNGEAVLASWRVN